MGLSALRASGRHAIPSLGADGMASCLMTDRTGCRDGALFRLRAVRAPLPPSIPRLGEDALPRQVSAQPPVAVQAGSTWPAEEAFLGGATAAPAVQTARTLAP